MLIALLDRWVSALDPGKTTIVWYGGLAFFGRNRSAGNALVPVGRRIAHFLDTPFERRVVGRIDVAFRSPWSNE